MILFTQCVMLVLKDNGKNSAINDDRFLKSRFNFIESIKYSFVLLGNTVILYLHFSQKKKLSEEIQKK